MSDPAQAADDNRSSPLSDWPVRAADAIDHVVAIIRDRAIRPVILVVRVAVFGLIIASMGLVVLVLSAIGLVRLLDLELFGGRVWASDAVVGGIFVLGGLFLWSRRTTKGVTDAGSVGRRK